MNAPTIEDHMAVSPLRRIKPTPTPPIHPVPEIEAQGALLETYQNTKQVLQVPWMGVVTMAFAHYTQFYSVLWHGLRPLCASQQFDETCNTLRHEVEQLASTLPHRTLERELLSAGYATGEIDQIRDMIEVFSAGNMPYIMLATQARLLLENHSLSSNQSTNLVKKLPVNGPIPLLMLIEPHHGNTQLQELYEDIKTTLGLPFVNTDYRALARWPSYFDRAWQNLKPNIATDEYASVVTKVHKKAVQLALDLPNPGALTSDQLQTAAKRDASLDEVLDVVRLFQYLLPGLAVNVGFFRAQLLQPDTDQN